MLRALSLAYPLVFLSVAAFMVNAVLARLIRMQREQIAQLKALGYSSWQVGIHYLKFALVIVVLGTIFGAIGGRFMGGRTASISTPSSFAFHPWNSTWTTARWASPYSSVQALRLWACSAWCGRR